MKTTEEYLDDYFDHYNDLKWRNETWRLRCSAEEFLAELDEIKKGAKESRKSGYLNEYHIQSNVRGQIAVLLMEKMTVEEFKEQCERHKIESKRQRGG